MQIWLNIWHLTFFFSEFLALVFPGKMYTKTMLAVTSTTVLSE